jgi:hypothetical protein
MTTLVETMTTKMEVSPDISLSKTELFDVEFAKQLSAHPQILKEEKEKLKRMIKERVKGNELDITYKLGKNCKHEFLGRFCSLRGLGLQNLQKDIRSAIAQEFYWDLDMINAQPTLLKQYCEKNGFVCTNLKKYIDDREELLTELEDVLGIQRWESKQKIVSILFGGSPSGLTNWFETDFTEEIRRIQGNIWDKNFEKLRFVRQQPNHLGKAMAYILQTEERICLMAMDKSISKHGRSMDVLMHDGGLIRKKDKETSFPKHLIPEIEKDIKQETGYDVKLIVKPMKTSFVRENQEDDYDAMKNEFEKTYFKLLQPSLYGWIEEDKIYTLTAKDLIHQRQNLLLQNGESFIKKWVIDPEIRTYKKLVYSPKKEVPDDLFNIFTGFKTEPKEGKFEAVSKLLLMVCGNDPKAVEYLEKWFAHIIQKPFIKTKTCIVVSGEEGVGKDTIFNFIGSILGSAYFFNTSAPENNILHNFNSGTEKALLVKIEEGSFSVNKAHTKDWKSLITKEVENFTKKGQDSVSLDDFRNYVMTTNEDVPVVISETDRRFVLIKASSEKRGDADFWNATYDELDKKETKQAYLHHLLNLDITNFSPTRDRVITEYYKEVKSSFTPYHARYLQDLIQTNFTSTIKAHELFSNMSLFIKNKFDLNETRFGRDMKIYLDDGCIEKVKSSVYSYVISKDQTIDFLKKKNWWFEY